MMKRAVNHERNALYKILEEDEENVGSGFQLSDSKTEQGWGVVSKRMYCSYLHIQYLFILICKLLCKLLLVEKSYVNILNNVSMDYDIYCTSLFIGLKNMQIRGVSLVTSVILWSEREIQYYVVSSLSIVQNQKKDCHL